MIDIGRKHDLTALMSVVNDDDQPLIRRRKAYRMVQSIRRKMSDKQILRMRLRLIAATIHNDLPEIDKLGQRINTYERQHYSKRQF